MMPAPIPDTREYARLAAHADGVCLLSWHEDETGKRTLTVLPPLADLLSAHFEAYEADPVEAESLAALDCALAPFLLAHGYAPDPANRDFYRVFLATPTDFLAKKPFLSTSILKLGDNYRNLTTIDLPAALRAGCVAYGYIEDGCILSVALTHTPLQGDIAEVTLETACGYRGRGYGAAALGALTTALTARGISVFYRTRSQNTASARTALAVGFRAAGYYYRYLGRRV